MVSFINFDVDSFVSNNDEIPTLEALATFENESPELRSMVEAGITKLQSSANFFTGNLVEQVDADLWCLKIWYKNQWARLFFVFANNARIFLLNGYVSPEEKIIPTEREKARNLLNAFRKLELSGA